MKRYIRSSQSITSNKEFNDWYMRLSQPEKDAVDDLMEHSTLSYGTASDKELTYIKHLYDMQKEEKSGSITSEDVLDEVLAWIANYRTRGFSKFEKYGVYLEKHSIQHLINSYIKYFNQNVRETGNGFSSDWDDDDWMSILYKNGTIREINPETDEGSKRISIDNIDSIILDGSWGTAFAGLHITAEDYTIYDDIVDIRIEFDI